MRTGVSYMGHHNPKYIKIDICDMNKLQLDDVLVALQENDFEHFIGKVRFTPKIAKDHGLRPIAIFWGCLNLFGGGRSSQFLLEHPEGFQVNRDGSYRAQGCYMNPVCISRITQMIDTIAEFGFQGYFVDEPTPLRDCYCASCRKKFQEWHDNDLSTASDTNIEMFRQKCVVGYVKTIADYCKTNHPQLETMTCLTLDDKEMWNETAKISSLDNLGTDIYWVNNGNDVEGMVPVLGELGNVCNVNKKNHHEWLQCWGVHKGKEYRILEQGKVLIREQPDSLYVWAWQGQIGTDESCDDPEIAWQFAYDVLQMAKNC